MDRQQYLAVSLPAATASDTRLALAEVQDFAHTDMGRGDGSKWTFRMLDGKAADDELARACAPERGGATESVAFQPCPLHEYRSQDRRVVERWSMPGGIWELTAVFDGALPFLFCTGQNSNYCIVSAGHVSHDAVDFVLQTVPSRVKRSLEALLHETPHPPPQRVSGILAHSIQAADAAITSNFLAAFAPRDGRAPVAGQGLDTNVNVTRMLSGTTALLALYHEKTADLWVANVGDCMAGSGVTFLVVAACGADARFSLPLQCWGRGRVRHGVGRSSMPYIARRTPSSDADF